MRDNFRDIVENKLSVSEGAKTDPEMTLRQYMELKAARKAARDAERGQTGKSETEDESAETSVDDLDEFNLPKTTGTRNKRRTKKKTGPGPGSTRSNDSLDTFTQVSKGEYGMSRMLTHVVKPISVLLDPEKRESQDELARGIQHLGKLTPAYVTQSLVRSRRSVTWKQIYKSCSAAF